MKSDDGSVPNTPGDQAATEEAELGRWETEFDLALDSSSTRVRALLLHLRDCLRGTIPECATCMDAGSVRCDSGYVRCPDCRE